MTSAHAQNATLTKAAREHDACLRALARRDELIIQAVRDGMSVPAVSRAIGGRLGPDRIRAICRDAGVIIDSKPGPKPGQRRTRGA